MGDQSDIFAVQGCDKRTVQLLDDLLALALGAGAGQGAPVGPDHDETRRSLETLSRLVADDLISQAEYEAKRAEVLARL